MTSTDIRDAEPIRVLLADDHMMFRRGVRAVLEPFADELRIVEEARNIDEMLHLVQQLQPDVVLLDLQMPQRRGPLRKLPWEYGVAAIKDIKQASPHTLVLVLSGHDRPEPLFAALQARADGYITKNDEYDGAALADAIRRVTQGETIFCPIVNQIISDYHQRGPQSNEALTPRENEILGLLVQNKSNKAIAEELVISIATVKTHVANILEKLGLDSRKEIRWQAGRHGADNSTGN